jgi:acetyl esterase/lipase
MAGFPPIDQLVRMGVVHSVPGMDAAVVRRDVPYASPGGTALTLDVYRPAGAEAGPQLPVVLLIHGGPVPRLGAKNMGVFTSYGRLLAASGFAAVAFDHRFLAPERLADAAGDVAAAEAYVRGHAGELGIDPRRLAFWAFSGGGPFLSLALRGAPAHVRALVAFYAVLDLPERPPGTPDAIDDETLRQLSPLHQLKVETGRVAPILVARAGLDNPFLNASIDRFVQQALVANVGLDLLNHPTGRHAFDILDDDARSREIIARTIEFLRARL